METADVSSGIKDLGKPNSAYTSMKSLWSRSRAICGGERYVKEFDKRLDTQNFSNLLLPFSPSMTPAQYAFYTAEAELPGIVSQYAKMLVGGLLRKAPQVKLPESAPAGAVEWILHNFDRDGSPLLTFLDTALWEEIQTNRSWIYVDYPNIPDAEELTTEEFEEFMPYPVLWTAESVVNWRVSEDSTTGEKYLSLLVRRCYEEVYSDPSDLHPSMKDVVYVHDLPEGKYRVRRYVEEDEDEEKKVKTIQGKPAEDFGADNKSYILTDTFEEIMVAGEYLDRIPAWPLNGSIEPCEPLLTAMVNREVALYNKISRRNHLLYGAATYTPYVKSDMNDEEFTKFVQQGLGAWMKIGRDDDIGVLETPTKSLSDMEKAIASSLEEMARMGLRMLAPENAQSGVALELRNAGQTAQLSSMNTRVSSIMREVISFMLQWRYGVEIDTKDIEFELSADFNPTPIGADWLRLVTEWYEAKLIPRSVWLSIIRQNDLIPPGYDDVEGIKEINEDELTQGDSNNQDDLDLKRELERE